MKFEFSESLKDLNELTTRFSFLRDIIPLTIDKNFSGQSK